MDRETLVRYLEYYRDLGVPSLWVRPAPVPTEPVDAPVEAVSAAPPEPPAPPPPAPPPPAKPPAAAPPSDPFGLLLPSLAPEGDTLERIRADIGDCTRCRLHEGRNKIVFGSGNEKAPLVFVGEGPGADEDEQGLPFVGRAGQLLTQMIEGTAKKEGIPLLRSEVYICNVVKCRPPNNRTPEPDEMATCGQFLFRQLLAIQPKAICTLGGTATRALLGAKEGVTKLRGKWTKWRDIPVMVTYHPSFLLRPYNQNAKREAWEDLKALLHFVYD